MTEIRVLQRCPQSFVQLSTEIEGVPIIGTIVRNLDDIYGPRDGDGQPRWVQVPSTWPQYFYDNLWYQLQDSQQRTLEERTRHDIELVLEVPGCRELLDDGSLLVDRHEGVARHRRMLARMGYSNSVGFEEMPGYRAQARQLAREEGIAAFSNYSMEALHPYHGQVGVVLSMFNSFGYAFSQVEDERDIQIASEFLRPGGIGIWDLRGEEFQKHKYSTGVRVLGNVHIDTTVIETETYRLWSEGKFFGQKTLRFRVGSTELTIARSPFGWKTHPIRGTKEGFEEMMARYQLELFYVKEDAYDPQYQGERLILAARKIPQTKVFLLRPS